MFGSLQSFRCDFKHPRQRECDGQTENDEENDQPDDPIRNVEHREYLGDALGKRPAGDDVGDGNLVNITPLQLSEEVLEVHNDIPGWRTLLNIVDLHDGAFRLRVLWILYHRHVQFVFIFVEGDVGRTSARAETVLAWERSLYLILSTLTKQAVFGPSQTCGKQPTREVTAGHGLRRGWQINDHFGASD